MLGGVAELRPGCRRSSGPGRGINSWVLGATPGCVEPMSRPRSVEWIVRTGREFFMAFRRQSPDPRCARGPRWANSAAGVGGGPRQ